MECAERYCRTVGNMRNAESCLVGGQMQFHTGCKGRRCTEQNIGPIVCRPMLTVLRNHVLDVNIR